ncbi:NAD(P)/FAD-dependent oxidoreductase [Atopobium fossor]|uniref:NAD(P)/FAD-dependent oxidoreductase n=1 Tax=Atopobium fossor TaxID=39487 RepID=UPI0004076554|nr:FAD-dependent oxidoreductase [Atopobium fossor]
MIQVSNLRVDPRTVDGTEQSELRAATQALLKRLHIHQTDIQSIELVRRSIDARKRNNVHLLYTVRAQLVGSTNAERALLTKLTARHDEKNVSQITPAYPHYPLRKNNPLEQRVVVVGAGCAGLFCALSLAKAGLEPILIERGDNAARRTQVVDHFNHSAQLDPESNIQFGVGGAGTFSDGKLATGTKSPLHRLIMETLVDSGASREILWDSHPHVGSDVLPQVVDTLCERITALGGEVRCRTKLVDLVLTDNKITGVRVLTTDPLSGLTTEQSIPTRHVVLASGHSARDVFEMLYQKQVFLERKTFAMGVRIEHLQADIDHAQYGTAAGLPGLGAAPYKLVSHLKNGRSAFSFCMCPGGYVVAAASEPEGVVTNGMSLSARNGTNANSGLLANVFAEDLPGDNPLEGLKLQRACEHTAFELGGGDFVAPAQLVGDFLANQHSSNHGKVVPTYSRGVNWGKVDACLPSYITDTLRAALPQMDKRLHGFAAADAVLTGVESRSSSPIRITRNEHCQSIGCEGLFPCGEGAGYAGGIMSAATDGLRVAQALIDSVLNLT